MSCDWDVYCIDCDKEMGLQDWNHASDEVARVIAARDSLAAVYRALGDDVRVSLEYDHRFVFTKFLADHEGHRLIPRDEYGECLDECGARFKCNACGHSKMCRRREKHAGEHSEKREGM